MPIAYDRERKTRIMGVRTFSLVAVGSCAYILVAEGFIPPDSPEARARIIQGLMGGIGFLGAGAILKRGEQVKGSATAAAIWTTGALGAAAAHGEYLLAITLSVMGYLVLRVLAVFQDEELSD